MAKIRIDEVFCQDCFKWYHWSELHKEERKFPQAIMTWLLDPQNHPVGIMTDNPTKSVDVQINEKIQRIRNGLHTRTGEL